MHVIIQYVIQNNNILNICVRYIERDIKDFKDRWIVEVNNKKIYTFDHICVCGGIVGVANIPIYYECYHSSQFSGDFS